MADNETLIIERYLQTLFSTDTALLAIIGDRAFNKTAPQSERRTCVIFAFLTGNDENLIGCAGIVSMNYKIVASGEIGKPEIQTAASRVNQLLSNLHTTSEGLLIRCKRSTPFSDESNSEGIQYEDVGGIYEFWV